MTKEPWLLTIYFPPTWDYVTCKAWAESRFPKFWHTGASLSKPFVFYYLRVNITWP